MKQRNYPTPGQLIAVVSTHMKNSLSVMIILLKGNCVKFIRFKDTRPSPGLKREDAL